MSPTAAVVVYGASGHTGRFVVAELVKQGFDTVASGRDPGRLRRSVEGLGPVDVRPASVAHPRSLDLALAGAAAVVNCAGPFARTAKPVMEAALRAGIPYVDVAAEIEANAAMFDDHAAAAQAVGTSVVPAMAFYGGLGDLLVTAAMGDWTDAEEVHIAYGLNQWHPTPGTRLAGEVSRQRRDGRRVRFAGGALQYHHDQPWQEVWTFPEPLGPREVVAEFTMADVVTIPSHLRVPEVRTYMTAEAARDIADPSTPGPEPVDELGRSDQTFVVDAIVRRDGTQRRASARGRDIYAVTAPLVVEAVRRILGGDVRTAGVASAGAAFDAADFLGAMSPHLSVELAPEEPWERLAVR